MFWIGTGSILLMFFGVRAYRNNQQQRKSSGLSQHSSRLFFLLLQSANIGLIIASLLFLMLAIVCHVKGYQINFSSNYLYHIQIVDN